MPTGVETDKQVVQPVMSATAGTRVFTQAGLRQRWVQAFAGMTGSNDVFGNRRRLDIITN